MLDRVLILSSLLLPLVASAQITDPRLPISLDAESTSYDGKSSMLLFRGLRLTQGNIGIEADEGRATDLKFENSVWQFTGNVIIDVEGGHIECDSADLQFNDHQLKFAMINGTPATFELTRPGSDEKTYAEAGKLRYDLDAGTIEFSENATITEGGNRIASDHLIYDIQARRINAQGTPEGNGKVKITYTPADLDEEPAIDDPGSGAPTDGAADDLQEPTPEDEGQDADP